MDYSNTTKGLQRGNTLVRNRRLKRAGILVDKETSYKKLIPKYLACGIRGHTIQDYWYLFKDKRPIGVTIRDIYINRALKKVEKNKDLAN